MTSNKPYDPTLIELKNKKLQEDIVQYLGIIDSITNTMLTDVDNPCLPTPNEKFMDFGENLALVHSAGNVFLHHLKQIPKVSE